MKKMTANYARRAVAQSTRQRDVIVTSVLKIISPSPNNHQQNFPVNNYFLRKQSHSPVRMASNLKISLQTWSSTVGSSLDVSYAFMNGFTHSRPLIFPQTISPPAVRAWERELCWPPQPSNQGYSFPFAQWNFRTWSPIDSRSASQWAFDIVAWRTQTTGARELARENKMIASFDGGK